MKKNLLQINYWVAVFFAAITLSSCDKGLVELNQDPDAYSEVIPEYLFTKAQLSAVDISPFGTAILTIGGAMQQFATYKEVPAAGDKYFNDGYSKGYFNGSYDAVNEIEEVIRAVSEDPEDVNKLSAARIWRVYIFHHLTDLYGDVPYTEAGKGSSEGIYTPKYDEQSFIYSDMLNELEEAVNSFDPTKETFGSSDLLYEGNVDKWKRFAYSLMLRLGMRLTEVDETMAQTWVQKAIAGGVITEMEDIAYIEYVDGSQVASRNPIARGLMNGDYINPQSVENVEGGKLAKTFIDHLKETDDPRLNAIAVVWVESESGGFVYDTTTALQKGMPNAAFNNRPPDFPTYSEPHPETILAYDSPLFVMTSTEVYLLLAEAALRGWHDGDAANLYNNAVRSSMKLWSLYGSAGEISDQEIEAYLTQNPYKSAGSFEEKMEQIQTQKWVALFIVDQYEIFANWRRTGYPVLTPVDYPGNLTGGKIPTRFVLPDSESTINAENYQEALDRQGVGDSFTSTVWWDQ